MKSMKKNFAFIFLGLIVAIIRVIVERGWEKLI